MNTQPVRHSKRPPYRKGLHQTLLETSQVLKAELLRHLRVSPGSTLMATVVFPFLTIFAIYALPQLKSAGTFHLQRGAYSVTMALPEVDALYPPSVPAVVPSVGSMSLAVSSPTSMEKELQPWLQALRAQPYYALEAVPDAQASFEQHAVDLALVFRQRMVPADPSTGAEAHPQIEATLWRRNDFFSGLFLDHFKQVERKLLSPEQTRAAGAMVASETRAAAVVRAGRSGIVQVAPFLLLGFAWFFMTVGAVEAFVVERERRTLEQLLSAPISRVALAWGKVLAVVTQAALPQLSGALAFVVLGFSPWIFSVVGLLIAMFIPIGVLAFWYYQPLDNAMAAGWRNGLIFMLGFPLIILTDDVVGTLSPLYYLGKALEGPPPMRFVGVWTLLVVVMMALASALMPRLARRWTP